MTGESVETVIRIAGIINESIVDGPGIRMVVFAQGCKHKCPGCHNPETHDFESGTWMTIDAILQQAKQNPLLDGLTFSGGEPFEQAEAFAELARKARQLNLDIVTYTGYTYEFIIEHGAEHKGWKALLDGTDILIDGRYEADKRNLLLKFRGSENQRMIDVKRSKEENRVITIE